MLIPDHGPLEPIEKKLPKEIVGSDGLDFFKVNLPNCYLKISQKLIWI